MGRLSLRRHGDQPGPPDEPSSRAACSRSAGVFTLRNACLTPATDASSSRVTTTGLLARTNSPIPNPQRFLHGGNQAHRGSTRTGARCRAGRGWQARSGRPGVEGARQAAHQDGRHQRQVASEQEDPHVPPLARPAERRVQPAEGTGAGPEVRTEGRGRNARAILGEAGEEIIPTFATHAPGGGWDDRGLVGRPVAHAAGRLGAPRRPRTDAPPSRGGSSAHGAGRSSAWLAITPVSSPARLQDGQRALQQGDLAQLRTGLGAAVAVGFAPRPTPPRTVAAGIVRDPSRSMSGRGVLRRSLGSLRRDAKNDGLDVGAWVIRAHAEVSPAPARAPRYTLKPAARVNPTRVTLKRRASSTASDEGAPTAATPALPPSRPSAATRRRSVR